MGFAALIPMLLPLVQQFLKGKSGDELSDTVGNNSDLIQQLAGMLSNNGQSGQLQSLFGQLQPQMPTNNNSDILMKLMDLQSKLGDLNLEVAKNGFQIEKLIEKSVKK
jgi:hypothetical protein